MVLIHSRTKKWGNSLGLIIPSDIVNELKLKENQDLDLLFLPKAKDVFHGLKPVKFGKTAQQLKDEARKALW
jgi:hypothetical protein